LHLISVKTFRTVWNRAFVQINQRNKALKRQNMKHHRVKIERYLTSIKSA